MCMRYEACKLCNYGIVMADCTAASKENAVMTEITVTLTLTGCRKIDFQAFVCAKVEKR